ncbi:MAG: hypothetical protein P8N52_06375 [Crocinitomicaceae bacterium]|nr:hypothetical protein [Crocinitomicaceae bacterium]
MNNFLDLVDKYKFGLIATLSVYIILFSYLQISSYQQSFPIEPFHEGSHVEIPENDIELKPENIRVPSDYNAGVKSMARDVNDERTRALDGYSENKTIADIEAHYKALEAQMYEDAGGSKTRDEIKKEMDARKKMDAIQAANKKLEPAKVGGDVAYSGNVMVDWSLAKRSPHQQNNWYVRNPGYTCGHGSSGVVTVVIKVNRKGNVTSAEYDASQSQGGNACMIEQAVKYAKKSRFSYSTSASRLQIGRISYTFISQ